MAYTFEINPYALRRRFSVYVVVAQGKSETLLYIGKTGDNREGCNPLISRCGNHFSYNKIHSQIRNKIPAHESRKYTYVFDCFDKYCDDLRDRRSRIDRINEMERWLNLMMQDAVSGRPRVRIVNDYKRRGWLSQTERMRRNALRTRGARRKLAAIINTVMQVLRTRIPSSGNASRASRRPQAT
jgi:hypothetical protein